MCVPVQWVARDPAGVITHVGGANDHGTAWGLSVQRAAELQESLHYNWFVEVPAGNRVPVLVRKTSAGRLFLTTSPDGIAANNLDALPNMPNVLSDVEPPWPLNIPGILTVRRMTINSIAHSGNNILTSLSQTPVTMDQAGGPITTFEPPAAFWRQTPRLFYLNATMPFPSDYQVSINGVRGPNAIMWVSQDDIVGRRSLEDRGAGWWSYDFTLTDATGAIDPSLPSRLTPVRIVVHPGTRAWNTGRVNVLITSYTVNPHCGTDGQGSGAFVGFTVRKPAAPTPPPTPQPVTVPSVVGLRLDVASRTLWGLGLSITTVGPVGVAADLQVDAQSPTGGTHVTLPKGVLLSTSFAAPSKGTKRLVISNQSNRAKPLDIWLNDRTTGQWKKETTVAYQGQGTVSLSDGHAYLVAAVDRTLNSCRGGTPDEVACVYSFPQTVFIGDDDGLELPWVIP